MSMDELKGIRGHRENFIYYITSGISSLNPQYMRPAESPL